MHRLVDICLCQYLMREDPCLLLDSQWSLRPKRSEEPLLHSKRPDFFIARETIFMNTFFLEF